MIGDIEYKDTGWLNVSCTKDGQFKRNGIPKKVIYWRDEVPILMCRDHYSRKEIKAADLVAKAWHPDYFEGCYTIPKDGNRKNIRVDNISCVSKNDFFIYRGSLSRISRIPKNIDWSQYGVFKQTPYDGLECTVDGVFRKNGRVLTVYKPKDICGRKRRCEVRVKVGDSIRNLNAAEVVAKTWSPSTWSEDVVITYKDGDRHNIHSDNLILVDREKYYKQIGEAIGYKTVDFKKAFEAVKRKSIEATLAYNYFKTGDLTGVNEYICGDLHKSLIKYASNKFNGLSTVERIVSESISVLYDYILANRPICDFTRLCQRVIREYKKDGGYRYRTPTYIERDNILPNNINSLCKNYKVTKIKTKQ